MPVSKGKKKGKKNNRVKRHLFVLILQLWNQQVKLIIGWTGYAFNKHWTYHLIKHKLNQIWYMIWLGYVLMKHQTLHNGTPSSVEKALITKVKVDGKRNGWSCAIANKSCHKKSSCKQWEIMITLSLLTEKQSTKGMMRKTMKRNVINLIQLQFYIPPQLQIKFAADLVSGLKDCPRKTVQIFSPGYQI